MKTLPKLILALCIAAPLLATLSGCAGPTLEQQIAVKEPGSWDFKVKNSAGSWEYIRIYDAPGKVGYFKFEYGQKNPCNQGFQKMIKTTAPGLVEYVRDPDTKSFACAGTLRYIFRTNAQGQPYEGWAGYFSDREKKKFMPFEEMTKLRDSTGELPTIILAN